MRDGVPFGQFVLIRKLGSGGMGELFLARPQEPGHFPPTLAVKRLHPTVRGDVAFAQSLIDEAVIGCHLTHPNIVRTYDVGQVDGDVFVAMEYVEGESLAALSRRAVERNSPCPWPAALHVALELADALEYLHSAKETTGGSLQLVHRDVSPGNVMLDVEGRVRLIDFGIARAGVARAGTRPGEIKANVSWAAPEQLNGLTVDARADLWGAGACLYALLTGAASPRESSIRAVRPDVPEGLAQVVDACLQTVPGDRPTDAATLRRLLYAVGSPNRDEVVAWVKSLELPRANVQSTGMETRAERTQASQQFTVPQRRTTERFAPGDLVARSTILGRFGGGGMGELWLARQSGSGQFEKVVLLKTISGEAASSQHFVKMFLEEARLAALINHPNVVQVFDCGEDRDCWYLAMEYLDGRDVRAVAQQLKQKGEVFPVHIAARIAAECASGLDFAHRLKTSNGKNLRLVHRDVSPENVVVTYSGQVKLIDFGIAKIAGEGHTQVGIFKGKLAYASPEQVEGRTLDARADVWSLGVVLYELCTGRLPFEADSEHELMRAIVSSKPAQPAVAPKLRAVILRALEKDPNQRYPDAASMRADLEAFLTEQPPSAPFHVAALMERLFPATDAFRAQVASVMSGTSATLAGDGSQAATVFASPEVSSPVPPRRGRPAVLAAAAVTVLAFAGVVYRWQATPVPVPTAQPSEPTVMPHQPVSAVVPPPPAEDVTKPFADPVPVEKNAAPVVEPKPNKPRAQKASLSISCNVQCEVYVDGRKEGRAPVVVSAKPGKHQVRAVAFSAGRSEKTLALSVESGENVQRKITFATGYLLLRTVPWANVSVDGRSAGQTPMQRIELFEGKHEILVRNPELGATQRRTVEIRGGEVEELSIQLK